MESSCYTVKRSSRCTEPSIPAELASNFVLVPVKAYKFVLQQLYMKTLKSSVY